MTNMLEGQILDVNSREYVCQVKVHDEQGKGYVLENVPFLSNSLSADIWEGTTELPERFSACLVVCIQEQYYILAVLPLQKNLRGDAPPVDKNKSLTHTTSLDYTAKFHENLPSAEGARAERKFVTGARTNRPQDALPGDKFWQTRDGSFLGILRGGVILARVHEFCQIMLNRVDGLCRIVVRNMQVFTDWGRIDILNDKNGTNMSIKVGGNYVNNKQEKFTVHLDVGKIGDLVRLRVTDVDGVELARTQIFSNGRIEAESVHSVYVKRGGSVLDLNENGDVSFTSEGKMYIN